MPAGPADALPAIHTIAPDETVERLRHGCFSEGAIHRRQPAAAAIRHGIRQMKAHPCVKTRHLYLSTRAMTSQASGAAMWCGRPMVESQSIAGHGWPPMVPPAGSLGNSTRQSAAVNSRASYGIVELALLSQHFCILRLA